MDRRESEALAYLTEISDKNVAVSFSGGKDSLVVLDLAQRVGIKNAVFSNTTIEFPETVEYIETIKDFYGINLEIVSAPITFFDMVENIGFPSRRFRWCCDIFKFGPLSRYAVKNELYGFITGLRTDESRRRSLYEIFDQNPLVPVKQINPIINWNDKEVWEYIRTYNLPYNPLYDHFNRIGCWCCPYKDSKKEWGKVRKLYPKKVKDFEDRLLKYAEKRNIKDKKKFIEGHGWMAWSSSLKKINIGVASYTTKGELLEVSFLFGNNSEKQIERITKLLPILTDNWHHKQNMLDIVINKSDKKKLNILVEKAINCVKCGACLFLCEFDALNIDDESINVDPSKCVKCKKCITTNILRGGCIIRNYSNKRLSLVGDNREKEHTIKSIPCTTTFKGKEIKTCEVYGHYYINGYCFRCGKPEPIKEREELKMKVF